MKRISELQNLEGKVALVTGGAGFLGRAICETLAELGATVIIASRDKQKCRTFASELYQNFNVVSEGIALDITDLEAQRRVFEHIKKNYGKLDLLVNDAWSGNKNTFDSISVDDWLYDVNVCLNGPFYTVKAAIEMLRETQGVILNVASMYGLVSPDYRMYDGETLANPPSYGAAKAGIIQLTRYLASFLSDQGIRVNAISPGPFPFESTKDNFPEFHQKLCEKTMLNRVGVPEDLKGVIAFLCTNASGYVTGQNVSVDGGWTSW